MAKLELIIDGSKAKQGHADWRTMMADIKSQASVGAAGITEVNAKLDLMAQELRENRVMVAGFNAILAGMEKQSFETGEGLGILATYILDLSSEARLTNQHLFQMNQNIIKMGDSSRTAAPQVQAAAASVDVMERSVSRTDRVLVSLQRQLYAVVGGFTALQAIRSTYRAVTEFEDGMVQVVRTAEIAAEDVEFLADEIENLSQRTPVGTTRLLEIATAAGQLGVTGVRNILAFTDTIARLETSTNLKGEAAAIALARILNVTGEAPDRVNVLGAAITKLDASVAASASEIAHISTEVALATTVFKLSSTEATALGAALATLGVQAENAGSSVGRVYRALDDAVRNGGAAMEIINKITGTTPEEFSKVFRNNSTEGFRMFIEGLSMVEQKGQDTIKVLDSLELSDLRILKSIQPLASNYMVLADALRIASEEAQKPVALVDASEKAWQTFSSNVKMAKNDLTALTRAVGNEAVPVLNVFLNTFRELSDPQYEATGASQALADAIRRLTIITAAYIALRVPMYLAQTAAAVEVVSGAVKTLTLVAARNPLGLLVTGAAIVIGSFIDIESRIDSTTDSLEKMEKQVKELNDHLTAFDRIKKTWDFGVRTGDTEIQLRAVQQQIQGLEDVIVEMTDSSQSTTFGNILERYLQLNPNASAKLKEDINKQIKEINEFNKKFKEGGEFFGQLDPKSIVDATSSADVYYMQPLKVLEAELLRLKSLYKDLQQTAANAPKDVLGKADIEARDSAREAMAKYTEELDREKRLVKLTGAEHAVMQAIFKTEDLQRQAMIPGFRMYQAAIIAATVENYKLKEATEAQKKAEDDRKKTVESIRDLIKETYLKADVADMTEQQRVRTQTLARAEEDLKKAFAGTSGGLFVRMTLLAELTRALDKLAAAEDRATLSQKAKAEREKRQKESEAASKDLDKKREDLQFEIQNASKIQSLRREQNLTYTEARDRVLSLEEAKRKLNIAFQDAPEKDALVASSLSDFERLEKQLREVQDLTRMFDNAGQAGAEALEAIAIEGEKLNDVLENVFKDLQRIAFRQFVTAPFANFIGGLAPVPSYQGNVFRGNDVVPMRSGGVISGVQEFSLGANRVARVGEGYRQEAAIAPLVRNSQGELGVKMVGDGGGQTVNVHVHVTSSNPDQIRKSMGQVMSSAQMAAARAFRKS